MIIQLYEHFLKHPLVSTDTRAIKKDSIFFALKGDNFNANEFAAQALNAGCSLAVIDEEKYKKDERFFLVDNVLTTLQQLANHHRYKMNASIIAITGSNGKTTSKELIYAALSTKFNVLATKANLNNHIGVPLTLLEITKQHQIAIIEMGANHQGEIKQLCAIAEPNFGIITNIGKAHLEGFGGYDGVVKAKSEMYDFIKKNGGTVFVNKDNNLLNILSTPLMRITFGTSKGVNYEGKLIECNPFVKLKCTSSSDTASIDEQEIINTQLMGVYNFENLLLAACVASYFKVSYKEIKQGLENYISSNNRSQIMQTKHNLLLLDAYNANPSSMEVAIENFAQMDERNKMVILGDMLELGVDTAKEHLAVVRLLKEKNIFCAYLVGNHFKEAAQMLNAKTFVTTDLLVEHLKAHPIKDSTILIKGSRGIKLEKVVEFL